MLNAFLDHEGEYNDREPLSQHAARQEQWPMLATAYRLAGDSQLNQSYGPRDRQRYDLFRGPEEDAPLLVFIHGGCWQRGDRKDYSFVARQLNANGITVAIPSYSLCP